MPDQDRKWITVAEAARLSGYSMRRLQLLLQTGRIEGIKPARDWLTTLEAVLEHKSKAKPGRPRKSK